MTYVDIDTTDNTQEMFEKYECFPGAAFYKLTAAVIWPKYCRYGVKHYIYIINQSLKAYM